MAIKTESISRTRRLVAPKCCVDYDEKKNELHIEIILLGAKKEDLDLNVLSSGIMLKAPRGAPNAKQNETRRPRSLLCCGAYGMP
ncbi:MAG TPA: hypothetical protein VFF30_10305 [Nitrososphaerales archaeon]|nr:hypothetical protein [Nitrososphaerales archaeon]